MVACQQQPAEGHLAHVLHAWCLQLSKLGHDWESAISVRNDVPVPTPAAGEVLLQVKLRPVNPADFFSIQGVYPGFQPTTFPCVPGMEGMGVVVSLGEGVTSVKVGQRVLSIAWPKLKSGMGLYQEYATVPADALTVIPDDIPDEQAACAVINPVTAIGLLEAADLKEGQWAIVTAAGSAERGIKTIGTVRRKDTVQQMLDEGFTAIINTSEEDLVQRVKEITSGKGAEAAFDSMCGDVTTQLCQSLQPGRLVTQYGLMTGSNTCTISVLDTLFKNGGVRGYWINVEVQFMTAEERQERMNMVFDEIRRGVLHTEIGKVVPLSQAVDAFRAHTEPGRMAKVLISS